jgi:hypothetical protein
VTIGREAFDKNQFKSEDPKCRECQAERTFVPTQESIDQEAKLEAKEAIKELEWAMRHGPKLSRVHSISTHAYESVLELTFPCPRRPQC